MREACCLWLSAVDRARLAAIAADRNSPQKHVWRAQIVLLSADRIGTVAIMRRTGKGKPSVWRWQARYLEAGVDGLLRDKTRPARLPRDCQEFRVRAMGCSSWSGAAPLAWTRLLRSIAGGADRSWLRRLRGAAVCVRLRRQAGPAVAAAGPLLPDASGRLL